MATDSNQLSAGVIEKDKQVLVALKKLPHYVPLDAGHSLASLESKAGAMRVAQAIANQKQAEAELAMECARESERIFHDYVQAAKREVVAQLAAELDQVQALGRRKPRPSPQ